MLTKGQKINDRYEIIKTIGEGGMANVYLAEDTILERKVAIKVLRGDLSNDEKFIRRFKREALSVSNLSHPNIVEVYDVGEEDGNYYAGCGRFYASDIEDRTKFYPIPDDEKLSRWVLKDGTVITSSENSDILNPEAMRVMTFDGTCIVIPTEQLNYVQDMCEGTNAGY